MMLDPNKHTWLARSVGLALLFSVGLGAFNMLISGTELLVENDAVQTAANIEAAEARLRLGVAAEIALMMLSIYVAAGFYILLKPVGEWLAVLMALFRLADAALQGVAAMSTAQIVALGENAAAAGALQHLPAMLAQIRAAHWDAFHIALMLSSAGAAIAFYLFFRSRFIPRVLSAWGVLASIGVVASNFAMRIEPAAGDFVYPWYVMANAVAFLALTFWLLIFGVNVSMLNDDRRAGAAS